MRCLPRLFLVLILFLATHAWGGSVTLVLSDNSKPYTEFSAAFGEALSDSSWRLLVVDAESTQALATEMVVTAGSEALRKVLARGGAPTVVATLLPRQNYEKILSEFPAGSRRITAILLDQPVLRQVAFIRHLLPEHKRVGMLWSSETRALAGRFQSVLASRGLRLDSEEVDTEKQWLPILNNLLTRIDVLLANPDTNIYHRGNIKPLLISTFRAQRPFIGFSETMTHAGALAALYSSPAHIARQAASLISTVNGSVPPPAMPTQFTISINYSVANSLGLKLPEENTVMKAMLADSDAR